MLYIDDPPNKTINYPICPITGWYATKRRTTGIEIRLGGNPIQYRHIDRPDVQAAFPGHHSNGFTAVVDLSQHLEGATANTVNWTVLGDGVVESSGVMGASSDALSHARGIADIRKHKREWLQSHLCCAFCQKAGGLRFGVDTIDCSACGVKFPQNARAFNLLPPDWNINPDVGATHNIPISGYDEMAQQLMQEAHLNGGKVLDCGAGLKTHLQPQMITAEIVDYPSTDVLAVGEHLPFPAGTFNAVFSFAVLEHVADPFRCAKEMMRVLKPGGVLYCQVPFLQPEHGYPDHYYNMTRSGLKNLFHSLGQIERHWVPSSGHPFYSLHWILGAWAAQLPEPLRERFRNMRIGELIAHPVDHYLTDDVVAKLSEDGKWILASVTAVVVRKPA